MSDTFQKRVDKNIDALIALAPEVQAFLGRCGAAERTSFKVQLALEEVVRNLIEHAAGALTNYIDVRIDCTKGCATILIEDDSAPFDPRSGPAFDLAKPLAQREPRRMGLQLLRALMDEIHYERLDGRNRLRLVIACPPV